VHVPSAIAPSDRAQTSQALGQGVSQQTPSETLPLAQLDPLLAPCPFLRRHWAVPAALHVCVPVHVSGSSALATVVHAPVPLRHVLQVPLQGPEQQMPSSQTPEAHSPAMEQELPLA
jgi:hypothetical protein